MRPGWTAAPVALSLAALVLAGCGARAQSGEEPFAVTAVRVPLNRDQPQLTRIGPLAWAGGYALKAPDMPRFGGVSGLDVLPDGQFVAITDAGDMIRGKLSLDADGRLRGVESMTIRRMTDEHGRPYEKKKDGDAEDVTLFPDGRIGVSFEQDHRIMVYAPDGSARRLPPPAGVHMGDNTGLEGLAYWTDPKTGEARLIEGAELGDAFACDLQGEACIQILDRQRDNPPGFRLTSLDALPDGRLVALYRAASLPFGLRAVIAEVRPGEARPVRPLAQLAGAFTVDNMEGLAAVPQADGTIRLYLVSDDNFSFWQRSLLLAFDWRPEPVSASPERR